MRKLIMLTWCLAAMAALLTSCATTQLKTVWKDAAYREQPRKVLVVAALQNPSVRRVMETAFVQQLSARGIETVPGFSVLTDAEEKNRDLIVEKVRKLGIDAVLVSKFMDKQTVTTYVPGTTGYGSPYAGGWSGYYYYNPGYYVEDQYAILVTNLFDVKTERLVWSATSETIITDADEQTVQSFVRTILDNLARQKVLPAPSSSKTR